MTRTRLYALAAPAAVVLVLFFALPVAGVVSDAFSDGGRAFLRVFALPTFWSSLLGSALLTVVASTLSIVVGVLVAMHLSRLPERQRTALSFVIALPLTFSGLIVAYGFILTYGRAGLVTQLLALAGLDAAVIGKALFTPTGTRTRSDGERCRRVAASMAASRRCRGDSLKGASRAGS